MKSLPKCFEDLPALQTLNLSGNKFGRYGSLLGQELWERLPQSLKILNLNFNEIHLIPCCLKNSKIHNLHIVKANLHYICPYLHTNIQKTKRYMVIDAYANYFFKHSFVPNEIYPLPLTTIQPTTGTSRCQYDQGIPNYANFSTTTIFTDEKEIRHTSTTKYKSKALYKFSSTGVENVYACKCCAMCGESTDEPLFEQIMAMDSVLLIKKEEGIKDSKYASFHSPFKPPVYFEPGQWRAKITSRLCVKCMKMMKEKIDAAFEEFKRKENEQASSPPVQQLYTPYTAGPSTLAQSTEMPHYHIPDDPSSTNWLPPISTLVQSRTRNYQYISPYPPTSNVESMDTEYNSTTTSDVPHEIVLVDKDGTYLCTMNNIISSNIADMPHALTTQEQPQAVNQNLKRAATTTDNEPPPKSPRTSTNNGYNFTVL